MSYNVHQPYTLLFSTNFPLRNIAHVEMHEWQFIVAECDTVFAGLKLQKRYTEAALERVVPLHQTPLLIICSG